MSNPLAQSPQAVHALANIEGQRAIQEVQAALVIAKRFPRDEKLALDKILNACSRIGLAEQHAYSFSRGGTEITGPSIRLAEAVAGYWGNIEFGFREINRGINEKGTGYSEVEAYAWDMESNTRRPAKFTVKHWRDTKNGGYAIKEERDIYELVANMAQRRVRACLLAVIPGDVIDEAQRQCDATLHAKADTSPEAIKKLAEAFAKIGVTKEQIEKRIQRRIDTIVPAQIISLRKIYASIKDGMSAASDWFDSEDQVSRAKTGGITDAFPVADPVVEEPAPEVVEPEAPAKEEVSPAQMIDDIKAVCEEKEVTWPSLEGRARKAGIISQSNMISVSLKREKLETIWRNTAAIIDGTYSAGGDQ